MLIDAKWLIHSFQVAWKKGSVPIVGNENDIFTCIHTGNTMPSMNSLFEKSVFSFEASLCH